MPNPTIEPSYAQVAPSYDQPLQADAPYIDFNTKLVEIRITTEIKTAKGVGGIKYGKWTAEVEYGGERKMLSATDEHQTIHSRGAVLAAVAALGALKRRCAIQLYTDSEYLLEGTVWLRANLALGWHQGPKAGRIRNHAIWGRLRDLAARHDIQWIGPRNKGEFADTMPEMKTEIWRRTIGDGPDTGYLYAGNILPWDDSQPSASGGGLGEYRAFTDTETRDSPICSSVNCADDNAVTPLTAKEKQARKKIIQRIAEHFRPEHIHPAPRQQKPSPPITPTILEPSKVKQLVAAFEELQPGTVSPSPPSGGQLGTVSFLRYPRATLAHRFPTARTARLELTIGTQQ
jgi:ribonuclease HI